MYFSTETGGLWYSNNINTATPTFSLVNAYPFRHPMRVFFNPWNTSEMWVSSFGYGMAMANTSCTLAAPSISQSDSVLSSSTASSYQWLLNGTPINGAASQSYTPAQSGSYSVQISNGSGCTATSQSVLVCILAAPTVNQNNYTLTSSSGATYQWLMDGSPITGGYLTKLYCNTNRQLFGADYGRQRMHGHVAKYYCYYFIRQRFECG